MIHSNGILNYKIIGAALVLVGLFLIAKLGHNLLGLALMFVGFFIAMKMGMKPE